VPAFTHRPGRSRGQSLVEFALTLPIFMMLVLALLEGGIYVYSWTSLGHAVNSAARVGAIRTATMTTVVNTIGANMPPTLSLQSSPAIQVNGGAVPFGSRTNGERLTVSVSATYAPISSMLFSGASLTLTRTTDIMVE
jgi:Flp pilus assembly protein TadG